MTVGGLRVLRVRRRGQRDEDTGDVHAGRLGESRTRHGADDVLGLLGRIHQEDDLAGGHGDPLGPVRFPAVGQSASRAPGCGRAGSEELVRSPLLEPGQQGGGTDAVPQPRRGEDEALIPVGFKHDKMHRQLRSDGGAALRPGTVLPDTRLA